MNTHSLTVQLKEYALSHGVDLIGITSAKPFVIRDGTKTIIDPKELLDDAQAVIVTAIYTNEVDNARLADKDNPRGRYAHMDLVRGFTPIETFYAETIKDFLERHGYETVSNRDERIPNKLAASRAGVGKYGKNAVIVTEAFGSYVMLVTLITNAPLEYDEYDVYASDCGKCEICLKSCPTGAIYEPYKLNRELCITEWLWGTFVPVHLREKQGNLIFGCGECLVACPKNKKLTPRIEYPIKIENVSTAPELIPLVTGDEEYYRETIPSFPMRAGLDAIRGNAIIALGNIGTDTAIEPLCTTFTYPNPQIRAYSAWALGKIGGVKVKKALGSTLKREENLNVRKEIQQAFSSARSPSGSGRTRSWT